MTARSFVQRRNVIGLRPLVFALVSLLGTIGAVIVPAAMAWTVLATTRALGVAPEAGVVSGFVTGIVSFVITAHVIGRGLEEAMKLRAPWGRIAIGAEGVRWDGWVRRKLTPWREVHGTIREGDSIVVVTREGTRIVLATTDASALGVSIVEARATYASSERAEIPGALGSERDTPRWIERVRTLLARDSYRDGGVPPTTLARVLEDPDAPAAARVGAAAALIPGGTIQRDRVARVRDESVDDELASVLDDLLEERVKPARWAKLARRA